MDDRTLEDALAKLLQSDLVSEQIEIIWHAGEPLIAGVEFYERAVELIREYNTRGLTVLNSIQTNGTLIDERWCEFFLANNFAVGISIDGPAFLHDIHRTNWAGSGSHRAAMRGFRQLVQHGLVPGVICVLTRTSLKYPQEIFSFFLENGFEYVAFNLEEVENVHTRSSIVGADPHDQSVIAEEYRVFLSTMYDLWLPQAGRVNIREFRDLFSVFSEILTDVSYCAKPLESEAIGILTIQRNGDITAFSPEFAGAQSAEFGNFVIGNIGTHSLGAILYDDTFIRMRDDVYAGVQACQNSCMYFAVCGGAFASNKYFENGSLRTTETTTCILHRQVLASVLLEKLKAPLVR